MVYQISAKRVNRILEVADISLVRYWRLCYSSKGGILCDKLSEKNKQSKWLLFIGGQNPLHPLKYYNCYCTVGSSILLVPKSATPLKVITN